VLKAETQEQARARLSLCALTAQTLKAGLALLGIEAPDKM
jgi:arginyl-tRNA synthetase